jgi:hypothetical protein
MRDKLNSNPMVQLAVIGVLLLAGAVFVFSSMGGGGAASSEEGGLSASSAPTGEGPAPSPAEAAPAAVEGAPSAGTVPTLATRPVPKPVLAAWKANQTVVLLFVHDGGIDDDLVKLASGTLAGMPGVTAFTVPASKIAHYAAITQGVGVDRVPALVVLRPKRLDQSVPSASVSYGFQDSESIRQAVIDAGYKGPTLEYHP